MGRCRACWIRCLCPSVVPAWYSVCDSGFGLCREVRQQQSMLLGWLPGPLERSCSVINGKACSPKAFLRSMFCGCSPLKPLRISATVWKCQRAGASFPLTPQSSIWGRGALFLGWSGRTGQWGIEVQLRTSVASGCPGCCLPSVQHRCSAFSLP